MPVGILEAAVGMEVLGDFAMVGEAFTGVVDGINTLVSNAGVVAKTATDLKQGHAFPTLNPELKKLKLEMEKRSSKVEHTLQPEQKKQKTNTRPLDQILKGKVRGFYQDQDDGSYRTGDYKKPKSYKRTTKYSRKPAYKTRKPVRGVYRKKFAARKTPYARWSGGARGRGVVARRYGRYTSTYGRSMYGTGRRLRRTWTPRRSRRYSRF